MSRQGWDFGGGNASRMESDRADSSERSLALLAVALAVVMFGLPLAIPFPLLDPDEGLHASIAQEMVERGDWLMPKFLGQPFHDKPILFFWAQAASLRLFGTGEAAVRLPGLVFGLLGAITTGLLAWRLVDRKTGWIAGILYATTILPTAMAQAASHDVALIPWINLAILLLWESGRVVGRRAAMCLLGAGVFLGLSILTKGLFGVAVVGLAYGSYLVFAHRMRPAVLLHGVAVVAVALLVAMPWYLAVERQTPGYLRYFFLERHVMGLATSSQPHGNEPWWYYLPILLGGGLPWIGYLPVVVRDGLARRRLDDSAVLLWCWLIGWTLLMTLAGSKLATYIWPVFPAIAVLAATAWAKQIEGSLDPAAGRSFARTFVSSSWSGPIVLPTVLWIVQVAFGVRFGWPAWAAVCVVALAAPLPLIAWRAERWTASLAAASLSLAAQFLVVLTLVLPMAAEVFSARALAEYFNRQGRVPTRLFVGEERVGSLVYYLTPSLRAGLKVGQLRPLTVDDPTPLRAGDVVAVPERRLSQIRECFDVDGMPYESVGRYRVYVVERDSPEGEASEAL